jgi:endoglucanase
LILANEVFPFGSDNDSTPVQKYGQIRVEGNRIVDQNGNPIALYGMSLFWSQWIGKYYNPFCIEWLRSDWKITVIRAAMGIEPDGYLTNPDTEKNKMFSVIDKSIDLGIYVIVDWHDHNAHTHQAEAIDFFAEIAALYGDQPNLIYEIYNEPTQVSWSNVVKPYAEAVIDTIRSIDPDNLIIVGT